MKSARNPSRGLPQRGKDVFISRDALGLRSDSDFPRDRRAVARQTPDPAVDANAGDNQTGPARALRFHHRISVARGRCNSLALQCSWNFSGQNGPRHSEFSSHGHGFDCSCTHSFGQPNLKPSPSRTAALGSSGNHAAASSKDLPPRFRRTAGIFRSRCNGFGLRGTDLSWICADRVWGLVRSRGTELRRGQYSSFRCPIFARAYLPRSARPNCYVYSRHLVFVRQSMDRQPFPIIISPFRRRLDGWAYGPISIASGLGLGTSYRRFALFRSTTA